MHRVAALPAGLSAGDVAQGWVHVLETAELLHVSSCYVTQSWVIASHVLFTAIRHKNYYSAHLLGLIMHPLHCR